MNTAIKSKGHAAAGNNFTAVREAGRPFVPADNTQMPMIFSDPRSRCVHKSGSPLARLVVG
jgi:hypothetical protein